MLFVLLYKPCLYFIFCLLFQLAQRRNCQQHGVTLDDEITYRYILTTRCSIRSRVIIIPSKMRGYKLCASMNRYKLNWCRSVMASLSFVSFPVFNVIVLRALQQEAMKFKNVYRKLNLFLLSIGIAPFLQNKESGHFEYKGRYVATICICIIVYLLFVLMFCTHDVLSIHSQFNQSFTDTLKFGFIWTKIFGYIFIVLLAICYR